MNFGTVCLPVVKPRIYVLHVAIFRARWYLSCHLKKKKRKEISNAPTNCH